jgi:hypothetical protein
MTSTPNGAEFTKLAKRRKRCPDSARRPQRCDRAPRLVIRTMVEYCKRQGNL